MEGTSSPLDAEAVADLVLLDPLTEESLVQTLQERFRRQDIYVSRGTRGLGRDGRGCWGESGIWGLTWELGGLQGLGREMGDGV